ncbi:Transcription elongation factor S-II [Hyphodiscus hymeniophilus]|uniref:Transcription elongation factor S-II n=1 Tax=Hyphodiscus hymeniophilus TaxID=353542 RepID=A0A9P7AZP9_9HELO|nr:Transcription elongation factor S-II [Hyphodiscus hymeniophilus]
MDQREVETMIKSLQKALAEKDGVTDVITIMEKLKKDVVPTEDLLRATKAGMVVAKQRGHTDKTVGKLASEIVTKWKKTVEAEKAKKQAKMASSPAKISSPAPTETKAFTGDKSKRRWETDKVDVKRTGTPSRDACIGLMYNGLAFMSEDASDLIISKAVEVEGEAFKAFGGDNPEYRAKMRSLFQNLKAASNRELGPRVMSNEILADRFVVMSYEDLKSAKRREEDNKLNEDNMKKAQVPQVQQSISDSLRCGRCSQKKVAYTQAQTRSADEPMTTFCECTHCGHRWKINADIR